MNSRHKVDKKYLLKLADAKRDQYRRLAKQNSYRSRAVYKLLQIDKSHHILKKGMKIVDIGAAPGGWLQAASKKTGNNGLVIGIDLKDIEPIPNVITIKKDVEDKETLTMILELLDGKADMVLSDLAPNVSGLWEIDHLKQIDLTRKAVEITKKILRPEGNALYKVFQGEATSEFISDTRKVFSEVILTKPDASRKQSSELYLLCKKHKPTIMSEAF
ncbi:RlmE family RNA methyltransferase [Candidatus Nitrosocosmicus franklandus]|uniref:Ribosomal RNA large subunit methyltransferase E n=1 Tax=Candidatus Nitrosocosmicus franklandianus TaxID=1798806 RepID=A0A484I8C4_9ARCH|nr:RlmE family RNA methyltransferase [Candidatus Nitrosocosmicus franklandus]VFJ13052.1 Ribosomal RNA large subunit methyltransferase E [Candidatus Nitrosocosmicus franklandus]